MRSIIAVLLSVFTYSPLLSIVISAEYLVKKDALGNIQQQIILLGDRHTYYLEYPEDQHVALTSVTAREQSMVFDLAKSFQATVLVEDYYSSSWEKVRWALAKCRLLAYHKPGTFIVELVNACKKQGITALNIEGRDELQASIAIGAFNATAFVLTLNFVEQYILKGNMTYYEAFIDNYKKWLGFVGFSLVTTALPLINVYKNTANIMRRIDALCCKEDLQQFREKIAQEYKAMVGDLSTAHYGWTVDFMALLPILENPTKNYIMCAGAYHTANVRTFLEQQGYVSLLSLDGVQYSMFGVPLLDSALDLSPLIP